ncbi:MAG: 50S ribosomal protein L27 [Candidatus Sungbacteria bacterium]|uniref:Large ribosomal subunit protein bL27 n=1 Tax=Candidatus Sungiibacteriota bacterium TaxID=2750080 RepID=A0A9D6DQK4_9BACT|nr:50S ribosomal protein L27 [Candidatus Sungbacteria bacterium]
MAHTKAVGSTRLGRDSVSKRLGVKLHDGQIARAGNILVKQRGNKVWPGQNVKKSGDDTLYAIKNGQVKFTTKVKMDFTGHKKLVKVVDVV